jgi:RHS repeat-associated protein
MRSIARTAVTAVTFSIFGYLPSTNVIPSAAAQFTDNPPGVSLHGPSGIITASPAPFTIDWCDDHGVVNHTVTVNGVDMTSSLTFVTLSPGTGNCTVHKQSTGSLAMTTGNNTVIATATDSRLQTGIGQAVYRYTDVTVSPPAAPLNFQRTSATAGFTVKNLLNSTQTFTLSALCTGQLTGCSAPASVSIGALGQTTVAMSYTTDTAGTSGTLQLKAWLSTNSAMRDSASSTIDAASSLSVDGSFNNNDNQALSLCTANCFAATVAASTMPYFSLGAPRNVTLVYHGDRVAVRPFVYADINIAAGSAPVLEYWLQVKDSASSAFLPFTNGDATKIRYSSAQAVTRLVAQIDASQYQTSMRKVFIIVTAHRTAFDEQVTIPTKLMIVNERASPSARGWTLSGIQRLYPQPDGTALVTQGDGSAVYFGGGCTAPCTLVTPAGEFSRLRTISKLGVTTYIREYVDSTKVFFRSAGLMDSIADRFGTVVRLEYDASSRLSKVYDPFRTYNAGASRSYIALSYGATYGLAQIQEPGADGSPTGGRVTHVTVASDSTLTAIKDPDGDSTRFIYDGAKRIQSIIDRAGSSFGTVYDAISWKVTSQSSPQVAVDAGGGSTVLATPTISLRPWQIVGLPTAVTSVTPAATVRADTIQARITDAVGHAVKFTMDRWGQPLVITDPLNRVTTIARSGLFDTSVTHPNGARDRAQFSGMLPTMVQPFGGDARNFTYGAYGQIQTSFGSNQPTVTNYIGTSGRIDSTSFGSNGYTMRYLYDGLGRIVQTLDPGKDTVFMHYESRFGNLDSVTAAGRRYATTRFDGRGRDSAQYVLSGAVRVTLYDSLGRVRQFNDGIHANATLYTYDKLHLIRVQDSQHQVYRFAVNPLGWQTAAYDPADTSNRSISYRYRADGMLTSSTNQRGQRLDFLYDSAGRLLSKRGPSNVVADSFAYNLSGTIFVALNATSRDSVFLSATGWTDSTVARFAADPAKRFHVVYKHDSQFRPISLGIDTVSGITFPTRTFNWNSGTGLLSSLVLGTKTVSFGVNNEGRRDSLTYEGSLQRTETYSSIHTLSNSTYNNSAINGAFFRGYGVDSIGRMSQQTQNHGTGTLIRKYNYSADNELRRTQELTSTSSPTQCSGVGLKNDFGNTCISLPGIVQTKLLGFTYDSVGNLLEERDSLANTSTLGKYAVGNRDTSWAAISYTYDLDGNRQRKRAGADSVRFYWSADNRLDSVNSAGLRVHYEYNALGQLVRKTRNGVADRYLLWGKQQLLAEFDGALTSRVGEYAYFPDAADRPIALLTGGQVVNATRYHQQDALGNVTGLSTLTGVVEQIDYSPWGQSTISLGAAVADTNRLQWKGLRWENDSTQLYYVRSRWYDPTQRRFVSEDPLGLDAGVNDYVFADNDPVNGMDPSGLCSVKEQDPNDDNIAHLCTVTIVGSWTDAQMYDFTNFKDVHTPDWSGMNFTGHGSAGTYYGSTSTEGPPTAKSESKAQCIKRVATGNFAETNQALANFLPLSRTQRRAAMFAVGFGIRLDTGTSGTLGVAMGLLRGGSASALMGGVEVAYGLPAFAVGALSSAVTNLLIPAAFEVGVGLGSAGTALGTCF